MIDEQEHISVEEIPPSALRGRRADQILAELFGLWTSKGPESAQAIDRYAALLSQDSLTADEEEEFKGLRDRIQKSHTNQTYRFSEQVEETISKVLDELARNASERISFEPEVRRQLQQILQDTETASESDEKQEP